MPGRRQAKRSWYATAERRFTWGMVLIAVSICLFSSLLVALFQDGLYIAGVVGTVLLVANFIGWYLSFLAGSTVASSRRVRIMLKFDQEDHEVSEARYNRKARHAASQ